MPTARRSMKARHASALALLEHLPKMAFPKKDDEIRAYAPQRAHQRFTETIREQRTQRLTQDRDSEIVNPARKSIRRSDLQ